MKNPEPGTSPLERFFFFVACGFLLLLAGMLLARYQFFPYSVVDDAIKGGRAAAAQMGLIENSTDTDIDTSEGDLQYVEAGVQRHREELTFSGYTLLISSSQEAASLIDMGGQTLHRWSLPVGAVRERFGKGTSPPDVPAYWRSCHLYPNGDLLVVIQGENVTPYGLGIFKIDKDSNLLWANLDHAHHEVAVAEDGRIYTISQEIRGVSIPDLRHLRPPLIEDFVLVLSPNGQTLHRISVVEAFSGTPFSAAVDRFADRRDWKGDYLHVNAIEPHDNQNTTRVFGKDQILISIRNMDSLATLDLKSRKIVWLLRGSWHRQHDVDVTTDGRIMLFDNRGDFARGGHSRVIEFDPITQEFTWLVGTDETLKLHSGSGANQQPLPNGNVLITEAAAGRLLEVTRNREVAWEYYNPARAEDGKHADRITEARRYAPSSIDFEFTGG